MTQENDSIVGESVTRESSTDGWIAASTDCAFLKICNLERGDGGLIVACKAVPKREKGSFCAFAKN